MTATDKIQLSTASTNASTFNSTSTVTHTTTSPPYGSAVAMSNTPLLLETTYTIVLILGILVVIVIGFVVLSVTIAILVKRRRAQRYACTAIYYGYNVFVILQAPNNIV